MHSSSVKGTENIPALQTSHFRLDSLYESKRHGSTLPHQRSSPRFGGSRGNRPHSSRNRERENRIDESERLVTAALYFYTCRRWNVETRSRTRRGNDRQITEATIMLIDTDVLVWCLRSHPKAIRAIDALTLRLISQVTRMELICGCRDKKEITLLKRFLVAGNFQVIPLSQEIGNRADLYLEEKHLSHGVGLPDALIAATASLQGLPIFTANAKHFRCFSDIQLNRFSP